MTVAEIKSIAECLGHDVTEYTLESDLLLNRYSRNRLKNEIHQLSSQPSEEWIEFLESQELVQLHNVFPVLSLADLNYLREWNGKKIRVVHNYRYTCIRGTHFMKGEECFKCDTKFSKSSINNKCYNDSILHSIFVENYRARFLRDVKTIFDHHVAISDHVKKYLTQLGIPDKTISVIPNLVEPMRIRKPLHNAMDVLYSGRISDEKGIKKLARYWAQRPQLPNLHIVGGTFPELGIIYPPTNIFCYGSLTEPQREEVAINCRYAIFPTEWEEPFGRTMIESMQRGQVVISTRKGIASEVFENSPINNFISSDYRELDNFFENFSEEKVAEYQKYVNFVLEQRFTRSDIVKQWRELYESLAIK